MAKGKTYVPGMYVAAFANKYGLIGHQLVISVAVARAESGFDYEAEHKNDDGSIDRGLWQINSVHDQYGSSLLLTPDYNAFAMSQISSTGRNWNPWTTYTSGDYLIYVPMATEAVQKMRQKGRDKALEEYKKLHSGGTVFGIHDPIIAGGVGGIESGISDAKAAAEGIASFAGTVSDFVGKLTDPHTWYRIGQVLFGAILVFVGLFLFVKGSLPSASGVHSKVRSKFSKPDTGDTFQVKEATA